MDDHENIFFHAHLLKFKLLKLYEAWMNFRDPNWSITQLLIKAGAAIEVAGWVTLSDDLIQVTPMELVESWTSKFGMESGLPLLKSIIRERLYARVNVKGTFFKNVTYFLQSS